MVNLAVILTSVSSQMCAIHTLLVLITPGDSSAVATQDGEDKGNIPYAPISMSVVKVSTDVQIHPDVSTPLEVITVSAIQDGRKFPSSNVWTLMNVAAVFMAATATPIVLTQLEVGNVYAIMAGTQTRQMLVYPRAGT